MMGQEKMTQMLYPTDLLENEHHVIAKMVLVASMLADRLVAGQSVEVETLQRMVEFLREYAGKCHHDKEEQLLFPLERKLFAFPTDRQYTGFRRPAGFSQGIQRG
jgi:hemerythrin-like domain-containing protein